MDYGEGMAPTSHVMRWCRRVSPEESVALDGTTGQATPD